MKVIFGLIRLSCIFHIFFAKNFQAFFIVFIESIFCLANKKKFEKEMHCDKPQEYVCLQGACLVFSKSYIDSLDYLFFPEIEFYCEEDFLLLNCVGKKIKLIYDPRALVYHTDQASTLRTKSFNDFKNNMKWSLNKSIESRLLYIDYLNNKYSGEK